MLKNALSLVLLLAIFVSGCASPAATVAPQQTEPTAVPPTSIPPTDPPAATATNVPPTATAEPAPTATVAAPANSGCTDGIEFISKETIPDNTNMPANEPFEKTWTFVNSGTCALDPTKWVIEPANPSEPKLDGGQVPQYLLNNQLTGPQGSIPSNGEFTIRLVMKAPSQPGTYKQSFRFVNTETQQVTASGFYVQIIVPDPSGNNGNGSGSDEVSAAVQNVQQQQGGGNTCADGDDTYNVFAKLKGPANAVFVYQIMLDGGAVGGVDANGSVTLNHKGGYDLNFSIVPPYNDAANLTGSITIVSVNGQAVNNKYVQFVICNAGTFGY